MLFAYVLARLCDFKENLMRLMLVEDDAMIGEAALQVWRVEHHAAVWVRATLAKSQKSAALLILRGDSRIFVPVDLG